MTPADPGLVGVVGVVGVFPVPRARVVIQPHCNSDTCPATAARDSDDSDNPDRADFMPHIGPAVAIGQAEPVQRCRMRPRKRAALHALGRE